MTIYTVTYGLMDQKTRANFFWHTFLFLSHFDEVTKQMVVDEHWGFYPMPTTSDAKTCIGRLKFKISLDVDLTGNHGLLGHEEVRALDIGHGLHGVTFELSEEKFIELRRRCRTMAEEQDKAIEEAAAALGIRDQALKEGEYRRYKYEPSSLAILKHEEAMANKECRSSRLRRFDFGFFTSHTCKGQVLTLLTGILTPQQIKRLSGGHYAISRLSGNTDSIFLYSSGPTSLYTKDSGEKVHFRDGKNPAVKLHWTVPPNIETPSGELHNLFKTNADYSEEVKTVVSQLQRTEWLFKNAKLDEEYEPHRERLLKHIRECYEFFSRVEPLRAKSENSVLKNYFLWMASLPRNSDETVLLQKVADAKNLLNCLYMAMVHDWEIDPAPIPAEKHADEKKVMLSESKTISSERKAVSDEDELDEDDFDEDIEALAAYLTPDKKRAFCAIVNRSYVAPEPPPSSECFLRLR